MTAPTATPNPGPSPVAGPGHAAVPGLAGATGVADGGRPRAGRTASVAGGPARPVGRAAVDVVVLTAAIAAALSPLLPVYGGTVLLPPALGGVLLGAALAVVSAWRR
ncbi:MAG TPA: hypothetical protein VGC57_00270, partial [Cellulomonas sp.]